MTTPVEIRAATPADAATIAVLMCELNRAEGCDVVTREVDIARALFADGREVNLRALVAQRDASIIGALLYYPGYDTLSASVGYHLADMVVTQSHRNQGIGKALMKALATQTLAENKEWISLTALKQNSAALAFYQSLGMTQVDVDFYAIGKTALAQL